MKIKRLKSKFYKQGTKWLSATLLAVMILAGQAPVFSAYEAHVINVTARIAPEPCAGYSMAGYKFNDVNKDGAKAAGEEGLAGWVIELEMIYKQDYDYNGDDILDGNDAPILQAVADDLQICPAGRNCDVHPDGWVDNLDVTDFQNYLNNLPRDLGNKITDQNGHYKFTNLERGRYQLSEVQQSGWTASVSVPQTVTVSQCGETTVNFGNYQTVTPACEMQLQKEVDKDTAAPGDILTYTLRYQNSGTAACAGPGVKIHDVLDAGLTYLGSYTAVATGDVDGQGITFGWYAIPGFRDNAVTWNANLVSPGESGTISFQAQINTPAQCGNYEILNKSQTYNEIEDWQDSNAVVTRVENPCAPPTGDCGSGAVDLRIDKTDEPNPAIPNQLIEYKITYSNVGNCPASGVVLTEDYDDRTNFIESAPAADAGTNNQWTIGDLGADGQHELLVTVESQPPVGPGDILVNQVCIDSEQTEPVCVTEETPVVVSQIALNEFLPNPAGSDDVPMPGGEWVELYNNGSVPVEVAGWVLYDNDDLHELFIIAGNTNTGGTTVPAGGFLVAYRNGDGDFSLNNDRPDQVRLYNGEIGSGGQLIDSYSYDGRDHLRLTPTPGAANVDDSSGGAGSEIKDNKSFARIPDGTGGWVDPVPTPGEPNRLEDSPELNSNKSNETLITNAEDAEENGGAETQNTEGTDQGFGDENTDRTDKTDRIGSNGEEERDGEENNTAQILPAENSEGDACLAGKVCDSNGNDGVGTTDDISLSVPDERMLAPP